MKNPGIVGGLGPASAIDYSRMLVEVHRREAGACSELAVHTVDMERTLKLIEESRLDGLGMPFLNTSRIHVEAAFAFMRSGTHGQA